MESISNSTCSCHHWASNIPKWEQGITRSSRTKALTLTIENSHFVYKIARLQDSMKSYIEVIYMGNLVVLISKTSYFLHLITP